MKERKLGRGLEFLLGGDPAAAPAKSESMLQVELAKVVSNPYQPRKEFDPAEIESLAASIRRDGLLQPIVVRKREHAYEIVAGERRVRACRTLDWNQIPATVMELSDADMLQVALAENIVRTDLNPIERAQAFQRLQKDFHLSHEEIGQRLGIDRSTVANLVRLLELPISIRELVSRGTLSMSHARALLSITSADAQQQLCQEILDKGLSVREVEKRGQLSERAPEKRKALLSEELVRDLESRLQTALGTKVRLQIGRRKGSIIIEYYGNDDLDRLINRLAPLSAQAGPDSTESGERDGE